MLELTADVARRPYNVRLLLKLLHWANILDFELRVIEVPSRFSLSFNLRIRLTPLNLPDQMQHSVSL